MLIHKDGGENVAVKNYMSHFSMIFPTKFNVKFSNGNMGYDQGIGIILCPFPNCPIIYLVGPLYYFPVCLLNSISLGDLKFYVGFWQETGESVEQVVPYESTGLIWGID